MSERELSGLAASGGVAIGRALVWRDDTSASTGSGDELLPTRPVSPYGVTKLAAENLCRAFAEEHGLPVVVLRVPNSGGRGRRR